MKHKLANSSHTSSPGGHPRSKPLSFARKRHHKLRSFLTTNWMTDIRNTPLYPVAEAARIVRAPHATIRTWFDLGHRQRMSFVQLTESYVINRLRKKHHMKMRAINKARAWLREKTGFAYPLALENLGFQCDGKELFFDLDGNLASATQKGQLAMRQILEKYLSRVEFDGKGIATRFYPCTDGHSKESPRSVVVDPRFNFGRPCLASCSISTAMITRRHRGGESKAALAADYGCETSEIDEAIKQEARAA